MQNCKCESIKILLESVEWKWQKKLKSPQLCAVNSFKSAYLSSLNTKQELAPYTMLKAGTGC